MLIVLKTMVFKTMVLKRHGGIRILMIALILTGSALVEPACLQAQDPAAERILRAAERLESRGEAAAALRELSLLSRQFPSDQRAPEALLRIAHLQRGLGDHEASAAALQRLLTDHARAPEAAGALNLQAAAALDSARGSQDLAEAQNYARRVSLLFGRDTYPRLPARREAKLRSGAISLLLGDPATAAAELVAALEDESPGPAQGPVRLALARTWVAADNWPAAVGLLEEVATGASAEAVKVEARRLLSLLHRRVLRPLAGQRPWLGSGRFPSSGLALREPSGVAAAADGRVLILDAKLPLLVLLAADGREIDRQALGDVNRPGWSPDGRPFVVGAGGVMLPFDATSHALNDPRRNAPVKGLLAAAPGMFDDWYAIAKGVKGVFQFPNGRPGRELLASNRSGPVDLAHDPLGHIYALDSKAAQVIRLSRDGISEGVVAAGEWKKAVAVDVDELGYIYVLDRGHRQVSLHAPDGHLMSSVGPDLGNGIELRNPVDIAVDGGGRLFIADTRLPFVVMLD